MPAIRKSSARWASCRRAPFNSSSPSRKSQRSSSRTADNLAFVTQTTLSLDDTAGIVEALRAKFPTIIGPHRQDICYATTNRQEAVKEVAPRVDAMIVVGSPNSSNSQRLREVAEKHGALSRLVEGRRAIDWDLYGNVKVIGVTAGASAPDVLVNEVIEAFGERFDISIETVTTSSENVFFPLPRELREPEAACLSHLV